MKTFKDIDLASKDEKPGTVENPNNKRGDMP
jgi:hypothetical protein